MYEIFHIPTGLPVKKTWRRYFGICNSSLRDLKQNILTLNFHRSMRYRTIKGVTDAVEILIEKFGDVFDINFINQ